MQSAVDGGSSGPDAVTPCGRATEVATVAHVKTAVETAIRGLQRELQHDLHEQDMHIFGLLGKGGFGTVHHGAFSPPRLPDISFSSFVRFK